jgi:hypothetical protein
MVGLNDWPLRSDAGVEPPGTRMSTRTTGLGVPADDDYAFVRLLKEAIETFVAIIDDLAAAFKAPRERILADVTTLLRGLADKRFLEL